MILITNSEKLRSGQNDRRDSGTHKPGFVKEGKEDAEIKIMKNSIITNSEKLRSGQNDRRDSGIHKPDFVIEGKADAEIEI